MEGRWREKMGGEGGGGGGGGGGGVVGGSSPVGGQVVVDHQRHLLHVDACPAPPPHAPPSRRAPSRPQTGPPQPHGGGRGSIASPLLPTIACHADDRAARADNRAAALQCTQDRARTAGEQVGGDEDAGGAAAELAHDELAALLVHVAVLPPTPTTPKHTHTRHQAPTEFNAVPRRSTQTAGCVEGWDGCAGGRRSRKPARRSPHTPRASAFAALMGAAALPRARPSAEPISGAKARETRGREGGEGGRACGTTPGGAKGFAPPRAAGAGPARTRADTVKSRDVILSSRKSTFRRVLT